MQEARSDPVGFRSFRTCDALYILSLVCYYENSITNGIQ